MEYIDGKKIRDELLEGLKQKIAAFPEPPLFCDILVGADPASVQYVEMKNRIASRLGIGVLRVSFPESATTSEILLKIDELNANPKLAGLIVQLPLPGHVDKQAILDAIDPRIDVDATGTENTTLFYNGTPRYIFPTAAAVTELLERSGALVAEKQAVVVGKGELVGRPVAHLLSSKCVVTTIDRETVHPETLLRQADIVISAAGQGGMIRGDMLKKGVILIDAGTSESYGSIVGDVDTASVVDVAGMLAPVPGGVGPVTIAMLFRNVLAAARNKFL